MTSDEVMGYEANGGYQPKDIYNNDPEICGVLEQLVDGTYSEKATKICLKKSIYLYLTA